MIDRGTHSVLGIDIDAVDYEAAVECILRAAHGRRPLAVSALAVHGVMTGVLDRAHRYRLNSLDLVVPDGQPVRWALRWLHGVKLPDRVYGPELMLRVCRRAAAEKVPIFLFGSPGDLLTALRTRLARSFPTLEVAGALPSKFRQLTPTEMAETIESIRRSGAEIVFVGLGCPRQEVWVYELRRALSMPLVAVGAAFAFHAGRQPQAPAALQEIGLEWFFRLSCEPRRLWKRYLLLNPLYLALLGLSIFGIPVTNRSNATPPTHELRYG